MEKEEVTKEEEEEEVTKEMVRERILREIPLRWWRDMNTGKLISTRTFSSCYTILGGELYIERPYSERKELIHKGGSEEYLIRKAEEEYVDLAYEYYLNIKHLKYE